MAKICQYNMWSLFILILWTTCRNCVVLSGIEQTTPVFVLERITTLKENQETGGDNLSMIEEAFRRQNSQILIPADSQNPTEEIDDLLALSSISSDDQRENITISDRQRKRERKKEWRIQAIKDSIFHWIGRNGTFNASYIRNMSSLDMEELALYNLSMSIDDETFSGSESTTGRDGTLNESSIQNISSQDMEDLALHNLSVPIDDETFNGSESTTERHVHPRAVDSDSFVERTTALSRMVTDWLASYHHNATEPDTRRERLWVDFADIGLDDTLIVPRGFEWIICSHRSNVNFEVFLKLSNPGYPLPIRRRANSLLQFLIESKHRMDSKCAPSGWKDMPIMYFNDEVEPRHAVLEDFLPTNCFCRN